MNEWSQTYPICNWNDIEKVNFIPTHNSQCQLVTRKIQRRNRKFYMNCILFVCVWRESQRLKVFDFCFKNTKMWCYYSFKSSTNKMKSNRNEVTEKENILQKFGTIWEKKCEHGNQINWWTSFSCCNHKTIFLRSDKQRFYRFVFFWKLWSNFNFLQCFEFQIIGLLNVNFWTIHCFFLRWRVWVWRELTKTLSKELQSAGFNDGNQQLIFSTRQNCFDHRRFQWYRFNDCKWICEKWRKGLYCFT